MVINLSNHWIEIKDADPRAVTLYERHYSCRHYADGRRTRRSNGFVGPCAKMVLLTQACDALFVWTRPKDEYRNDNQTGVNCAVFRNESLVLSSTLILEAEELAHTRWPNERLYTYINARKIKSSNPGYCYLKAGWRKCGVTKGGLVILEKYPLDNALA